MTTASPAEQPFAGLHEVAGVVVVGRQVEWVARTGSTNDDLKERARAGAREGLVLVTDEQTAGRGRRGRSWVAPPASSLLQSVLLRPTSLATADAFLLTMLAAVAAAEAIEAAVGLHVGLKWPNDLLCGQHKLGGILVETELRQDHVAWAVIGLGINVNWDPRDVPLATNRPTSIATEIGQPADRLKLFAALMCSVDAWYVRLQAGDAHILHATWKARLTTLGQTIHAATPSGPITGVAEDVDRQGGLVVRLPDGRCQTLHSGEITVRPVVPLST